MRRDTQSKDAHRLAVSAIGRARLRTIDLSLPAILAGLESHLRRTAFDRAHDRPGTKLFFHVPARAVTIGVRPVQGGQHTSNFKPLLQTGDNYAR